VRTYRMVIALLLFLLAGKGFAQKVTIDYDHKANFQGYKTYAWAKGTPLENQLWDQRIIDGIDQQLGAKGFQKAPRGTYPDLYVLYHGAVGHEAQLNTTNMGGGWGWRWGGGMSTTTVEHIPVGQLVIDIGDAKTKKLMWLANSTDTLSDNPDKNQKKLQKALQKMFKNFPPPPLK
jgi:hypothetical protein